jgi:hypothetical protein
MENLSYYIYIFLVLMKYIMYGSSKEIDEMDTQAADP